MMSTKYKKKRKNYVETGTGRPADTSGRQEKEIRVYDF